MVSDALTGKLERHAAVPPQPAPLEPAGDQRRKVLGWGFAVLWGGLALAVLLAIIGSLIERFDREMGSFMQDMSGLGGLVMLIGVGVMIYSRFLPKTGESLKQPKVKSVPQTPPRLSFEPERRMPVSSVTENTTNLLDADEPKAHPRNPARQRE